MIVNGPITVNRDVDRDRSIFSKMRMYGIVYNQIMCLGEIERSISIGDMLMSGSLYVDLMVLGNGDVHATCVSNMTMSSPLADELMILKEDEEWVFLAYDIEKITAFLESKGFALEYVSKLFFAQQSVDLFDKPLWLGEHEALVALDHTVVVIPRGALTEENGSSLVFNNRFTPKKGIVLSGAYGSVLTLKQASMLAAIFILFALMFSVEGSRYSDDSEAGEAKMQELLSANPSLQSKYTRDSILSKYKMIDKAERKKREIVKMVSGMIFKGVTLSSLEIDVKSYKVHFTCKDAQVAQRLNLLATKNKLKTSAISGSHDLKIEGTL
jgi:hypothetical protein